MKVLFRRIISLFTVFVICFSLLTVPAAATLSDAATSFSDWVKYYVSMGFWRDLFDSDDPDAAYTSYVSGLQTDLGTSTVFDGGVRMYFPITSITIGSPGTINSSSYTGANFSASFLASSYCLLYVKFDNLTAPFACTYTTGAMVSTDNSYMYGSGDFQTSATSVSKGAALYLNGGGTSVNYRSTTYGVSSSVAGYFYADIVPYTGVLSDYTTSSIDASTRTGSLSGNYIYTGDDGTQMTAENIYLFDESTNTVNNPQTGTTATASSWTYDYATRTYTIKATDGCTYVITMGDDQATQAVTNVSGDTITYNYYYASSSSSGGSGDDDSGTSWWEKILNKLSDGILAIFDLVGTIIGSIIGGLADLVTDTVASLKSLVQSMGQLPSAIGSLYTWMPAELQSVIAAAFTVVVFAGLIKFFL